MRAFMPLYSRIDRAKYRLRRLETLPPVTLLLGRNRYTVSYYAARLPHTKELDVYFVHCPELYGRQGVYTHDADEHLRFLVLNYAALHACQAMRFAPHVLHCNDWQTSLAPLILKCRFAWDSLIFGRTKTLLTIHNLLYQGRFAASTLPDTGLSDSAHLFHQDELNAGLIRYLLHGIMYADAVSVVSPTYAAEIRTPEHGAGLDGFLRAKGPSVVGILNGVDYDEWSPQADRLIPVRYGPAELEKKRLNTQALLQKMRLRHEPNVPVVGIVSRLAGQKGFDLLPQVLPGLMARYRFQLVVLGSGERRLERIFHEAQARWPHRVRFHSGFSDELAHLIEAGADIFLMPSVTEPCGLNQMYSLKYGTVPVVHRTGGLTDTVWQWNPKTQAGTGFVFEHHDAAGLTWALSRAFETHSDDNAWRRLMLNGMSQDFSWQTQVKHYETLYGRL